MSDEIEQAKAEALRNLADKYRKEREAIKSAPPEDTPEPIVVPIWVSLPVMMTVIFGLVAMTDSCTGPGSNPSRSTRTQVDGSYQPGGNYGYSDSAVREMRSLGITPEEARTFEQVCGSACE